MHEDRLFCSCAVHVAGQASQMHLLPEMGGGSLLEDATASYQLHGVRRRACCQKCCTWPAIGNATQRHCAAGSPDIHDCFCRLYSAKQGCHAHPCPYLRGGLSLGQAPPPQRHLSASS